MKKLYTDRLILRPFNKDDARAIYTNWTYDKRVAKYCRWYPHKDIRETKQYLKMCMEKEYCFAITLKEKDEPIGCVDVVGINSAGVPEIGYVLSYNYWGKGIMTEAAGIPKSAQYTTHKFVYDGSSENRIVYEFNVSGEKKYIIEHLFDKMGRGNHFHGADASKGSLFNKGRYNQYEGHFPEDFDGFD